MIEPNGYFTWEQSELQNGVRQDLAQSKPHYSLLRNIRPGEASALWKDKGLRRLSSQLIGNGSQDTRAGFDCHFDDATQILVIMQYAGSSTMKAYTFNPSARTWTQQSPTFAQQRPTMFMFTNKLIILDGTTLNQMAVGKSWTTPGNTYQNACDLGIVYAGRAVLSGNSAEPYTFWPSNVRNITTTDVKQLQLSVDIAATGGDVITCLGLVGSYAIVGGRTFTRSYYLGTGGEKDWDYDVLSSEVGPISSAFCEVSRGKGNQASQFGFFISEEGPMMIARFGKNPPTLVGLHDSLEYAFRGEDYREFPGISVANFASAEIEYFPDTKEVVFAMMKQSTAGRTTPRNDIALCLNMASAAAHAIEPRIRPAWRIRDNSNMTFFPITCLFQVQVASTGLPSTTGRKRLFCAQDGYIYEFEAPNTYKDLATYDIPFYLTRSSLDGSEDDIRGHEKSVESARIHCSMAGNYDIFMKVQADGGKGAQTPSIDTINLATGVSLWSSDSADGTWGDGTTLWNAASFADQKAGFNQVGRQFDVSIYDEGNVNARFGLDFFDVSGMLEDRR